jgi:type III pantothenate kinase
MASLVIDIGNTATKMAVFNREEIIFTEQYQNVSEEIIDNFLGKYRVKKAIISSVKNKIENWHNYLKSKVTLFYFNAAMAKGIINHYLTPETLGLDRLAAVTGAKYLFPGKSSVVIDAGTCITYDWVDKAGNYYGGSISPGLFMRYKALNTFTAALPLLTIDEHFAATFGNDTPSAIRSGVQNGIKYELEGFINSYKTNEWEPNIILTGGDSIFFDTLLKNSIFAPYIKIEPFLVLKGLNAAILNNND